MTTTRPSNTGRRTRVTRPYPSYTLEDALGVAEAIHRVNAGLPFDRELLAGALGTTPKSSAFTMRLNASATYGLTQGGYNDTDIRITELGECAVASADAESACAIAAAAMNPEIFGKFYEMLDGKRLPEDTYVHSLLQRELGVPAGLVKECLRIIRSNGAFAGIIADEGGAQTVRLGNLSAPTTVSPEPPDSPRQQTPSPISAPRTAGASKIFIGHIGASDAARFVASMLDGFGILSDSPSTADYTGLMLQAQAVDAMRSSSAAILIFGGAPDIKAARDKMLMLLGAASVLFDNRVVIFHETGADLDISLDDLNDVGFEPGRPVESGLGLLAALQKAGAVSIGA